MLSYWLLWLFVQRGCPVHHGHHSITFFILTTLLKVAPVDPSLVSNPSGYHSAFYRWQVWNKLTKNKLTLQFLCHKNDYEGACYIFWVQLKGLILRRIKPRIYGNIILEPIIYLAQHWDMFCLSAISICSWIFLLYFHLKVWIQLLKGFISPSNLS